MSSVMRKICQIVLLMCSDGNGGAIIAWSDLRGEYSDIYAQRINAAGELQWTENGVVISAADYNQQNPVICVDEDGGDYRMDG